MDYLAVYTLPSGQTVGCLEVTETEIVFDFLAADGVTRLNPSAANIAPKLSEDAAADISAALAPPSEAQAVAQFSAAVVAAVQAWMDARARQDGYDHILSACSYAAPPENPFAAEGNAYLVWRSSVWAACYAALGAHQSGDPLPTIEDFIATLPVYVPPPNP
ncbi:hypothetical protein [Opitutus terrae]|uniref:Uncharacterized protein n=1 Tax=Opitutus terrae (strain DSM 11246 / JCM 15787 / PB90-1) TaxID=452637 RepID=B1ZV41_OPITP|nr:hypothetical protein [Opitutus terrae]ACB76708.1 hypothetical protein Oter_3431 [Opitutus terrae PB90-1]